MRRARIGRELAPSGYLFKAAWFDRFAASAAASRRAEAAPPSRSGKKKPESRRGWEPELTCCRGLPHHHGVGVGGLAGGDHGGLVEDGGDGGESGHFDCW